jgi:hypothetical protein
MGGGLFSEGRKHEMALNILVNLMNTAAHMTQMQAVANTGAADTTAIRPASGSSGSRATSSGGGGDNNTSQGSSAQFALVSKRLSGMTALPAPDRAEAKSVVTAQGTPSMPVLTTPEDRGSRLDTVTPRLTELDRYAPPDPLPTSPILQAASAYAARSQDF